MKIHIAQKGETLWNIAKKYGVDFEELKGLNAQLSNPDMIMPGMKIKVPGTGVIVKKEMPIAPQHIKKEVPVQPPKKEMPVLPKEKPKEIPKEKPYQIYQPVMPQTQTLPEIDIHNYYLNMQKLNVHEHAMPEKKEAPVHHKEEPAPPKEELPIQGGIPMPMPMPVFQNYCYQPMMPICDPCYPQVNMWQPNVMPQAQFWPQPIPMQVSPMQTQGLPGMQNPNHQHDMYWDEESLCEDQSSFVGGIQSENPTYQMQQPSMMQPMQPGMPYGGGFPMNQAGTHMPYPASFGVSPMNQADDCGCGSEQMSQMPFAGQMPPQMPQMGYQNPYYRVGFSGAGYQGSGAPLPDAPNQYNAYSMPARLDGFDEDEE